MVAVATFIAALGYTTWFTVASARSLVQDWQPGDVTLPVALVLVAVTVFAPRPLFRTRAAAQTRTVLANPSAPNRPWNSTTFAFDTVLVGALIAGLYYGWRLMLLAFIAALLVRMLVLSRTTLDRDPNARFHLLFSTWSTATSGAVAFVIVRPLAGSVELEFSIVPLMLAALVAVYVGLVFNALERWVNDDRTRWTLLRDAVDPRRIVAGLVSAVIAWLVVFVGTQVQLSTASASELTGALAGLGILITSLMLLWFVSVRLWVRDALKVLTLWGEHQSEVMTRIADGSLSPDLAARAALPVTARMAVTVFAATRAMVVVDNGRGHVVTHLTAADEYPNGPRADPRDLAGQGHLRLPLYSVPGHPNTSSVVVARWLWPGRFVTRTRRIVTTFNDLATAALLLPVIASYDDRDQAAFDLMFDGIHRWPTPTAFSRAVERMQRRVEASPHTDSLLIGVYAIDDFGAIAGGRFEQAAVAQVMRLALGHQQFAGHDIFVAYEEPGRLWLALGGGPIIRNGIGLMRGLQEHINDHGSIPSSKLDVDVHVSVSFGYAAHQVDEFSLDGLMAAALRRLAIDQGTRDPFSVESLIALDFRPEDIVGEPDAPVTAVDTINLLRADAGTDDAFETRFTPIVANATEEVGAVLLSVGWRRSLGSLNLADPSAFLSLVERQPELAAEAARVLLQRVKSGIAQADELGHRDLPVVVMMPSILLTPDAGIASLPNLVTPFLDRREGARTVVMIDTVPPGAGQALRTLTDRGVHVAVTAAAAAGAEQADLFGWPRWGILFPHHVTQGAGGIDAMTVQQTVSAISTRDTRLIAVTDAGVDPRDLAMHGIGWTITVGDGWAEVEAPVLAPRAD